MPHSDPAQQLCEASLCSGVESKASPHPGLAQPIARHGRCTLLRPCMGAMHGRSTARVCTVCRCTSRQPCCTHDLLQHCSPWVAHVPRTLWPTQGSQIVCNRRIQISGCPPSPVKSHTRRGGKQHGHRSQVRGSTRPAHGARSGRVHKARGTAHVHTRCGW